MHKAKKESAPAVEPAPAPPRLIGCTYTGEDRVMIAGTTIRQDDQGRYCLNDLHKASGGERKHGPALWMVNAQTKELIEELSDTGNPVSQIKGNFGDGTAQGTYVCKELVYAYAMWISAKFHLQVIRTFDAVVTGQVGVQGQYKLPQNYAEALRELADTYEALEALRAAPTPLNVSWDSSLETVPISRERKF